MANHPTPASMLKESLKETLEAAKFCTEYRKSKGQWAELSPGGCLGYPSAILLFSIIDTIGSYYRGNKEFKITIENKPVTIDKDGWEHFKILNSEYFNQTLSLAFIHLIYTKFRSCLTHNSVLGKNTMMGMSNQTLSPDPNLKNQAFLEGLTENGDHVYVISIAELYQLCETAVDKFYPHIDKIVPGSRQGKNFN